MRSIEPIGDRVVVVLDKRETQTGGIVLAEAYSKPALLGTVGACGPGVKDLKDGDRVYVQKHVGTAFKDDRTKQEYVIAREGQLLAKVEA